MCIFTIQFQYPIPLSTFFMSFSLLLYTIFPFCLLLSIFSSNPCDAQFSTLSTTITTLNEKKTNSYSYSSSHGLPNEQVEFLFQATSLSTTVSSSMTVRTRNGKTNIDSNYSPSVHFTLSIFSILYSYCFLGENRSRSTKLICVNLVCLKLEMNTKKTDEEENNNIVENNNIA